MYNFDNTPTVESVLKLSSGYGLDIHRNIFVLTVLLLIKSLVHCISLSKHPCQLFTCKMPNFCICLNLGLLIFLV